MKFKVGDRVELLNFDRKGTDKVAIIIDCSGLDGNGREVFQYRLEESNYTGVWTDENDTRLLEKKTNNNMQKLNSMMKRLLDEDVKMLYKAGFLNGDLKLTTEGTEALNSLLFSSHLKELVELAKEKLAEEKQS